MLARVRHFQAATARPVRLTRRTVLVVVLAWLIFGYGLTQRSDATMADVLLAGQVLAAFEAWRRWGRFREEKSAWY